jgi:hypothetical protein
MSAVKRIKQIPLSLLFLETLQRRLGGIQPDMLVVRSNRDQLFPIQRDGWHALLISWASGAASRMVVRRCSSIACTSGGKAAIESSMVLGPR